MVLGSNRRQHWVSGRAVYAQRTNGNCSVIMRGGVEGMGDMMQPVIKRVREAGCCGGRQMWLRADLTHWASVLPSLQGRLSEKADGGATEETWCTLELRDTSMRSYKGINKDAEKHLLLSQLCLYGHLCVILPSLCVCLCVHECVSNCAAPAQSLDSLHGDRGPQIWHLRAQTRAKESEMLSVGSLRKRQSLKNADQSHWCSLSEH